MQEIPTQTKDPFGITPLYYRWEIRILENLPQGQEGIFWEGLKSDVQILMVEFLVFQPNKVEKINTLGILQPSVIRCQCWKEVSKDFMTGLPKS